MNSNKSGQFKYLTLDSVVKAEAQLVRDLLELKNEIEINELETNSSKRTVGSSIHIPNDANSFGIERKLYIERLLNLNDIKPIQIQCELFKETIETLDKNEYTLANMPILLHEFFNQKLQSCIYAKHLHLLRWSRFSQHTQQIEELYPAFKKRLAYILSEYNDAYARLSRLNISRELLLNKSSSTVAASGALCLKTDDLEYYLRFLISHFYSQKNFLYFIKLVEWFPHMKRDLFQDYVKNDYKSNEKDEFDEKIEEKSNPEYTEYCIDNLFNKSNAIISAINDDTCNAISFLMNKGQVPLLNSSLEHLLPKLRYFTKLYNIDYNLSKMKTQGDEMELFATVNRKFRHLFAQQEHMMTFKTYDLVEIGNEAWGTDTPLHALKKESNWLESIQLVPHKDPIAEKNLSTIKNKYKIDELLKSHSSFMRISNDNRVQDVLRENAPLVKLQTITIESVSVTSNKTSFNSNNYWKKIFSNIHYSTSSSFDSNPPGATNQTKEILQDILLTEQTKNPREITFRAKPKKKSNDFNYLESLQKYGLDDENKNGNTLNGDEDDAENELLSGIQGSYLAYLLLRHLRIRDLKRKALSLLNYYMSIQRTLTIYDNGLSPANDFASSSSSSFNFKKGQNNLKETSHGNNIGYHAYMYNTYKDFNMSENEFIEFNSSVDNNYNDYYLQEDDGLIHVQDHRGYFIVYDCALNELEQLEQDLLYICSFYIQNDSIHTKNSVNKASLKSDQNAYDHDLMSYTSKNIDRFDILLDAWTNEVNYLESKRKLIDLYYEIYQNIFDKLERRNVAQIIQDLIYKRPRLNLNSNYFVTSYRLEVDCLLKQFKLIKFLSSKMIDDMRVYMDRLDTSDESLLYGLPYKIIKKQLIAINLDNVATKNFYMLEYHPCLASLSRLPEAFKSSIEEILLNLHLSSSNDLDNRLRVESLFYSQMHDHFESTKPGTLFTQQIQKDFFTNNGSLLGEDPLLMSQLTNSLIKEQEELNKNKTRKESYEIVMTKLIGLIEMVQLRHRLYVALVDTELQSQIYLKQSQELGFDAYHMYLRYVSFDYAKYKDTNELKSAPIYVNELSMQDSNIDRYVSQQLMLAISELDESSLSKFNFKSREGILSLLNNGMENLQCVLKLQLIHNYSLTTAIQQINSCRLYDHESHVNNSTQLLGANPKSKPYSEAFVSIQMEKNPCRDLIFNDYIKQKESKSLIIASNPLEMDRLKRTCLNAFVDNFSKRVYQYSLRAQIIHLYSCIRKILDFFPHTKNTHFVYGTPNERKQTIVSNTNTSLGNAIQEDDNELIVDEKNFKKRPRKLLNDLGTKVLNLWFIPHYTDLLILFKKQSNDDCVQSLMNTIEIVSPLNDVLQLLFTNACINTMNNETSTRSVKLNTTNSYARTQFSSYENTGGLSNELNELQSEINLLSDPTNPRLVSDLLKYKRKILHLQYELAIKYVIKDKFLLANNIRAFKSIQENSHFTFKHFSTYSQSTCEDVYMQVPEPVESNSQVAKHMYPWRHTITRNGPYPQTQYSHSHLIEPYLTLCINGLKDVEKSTINGELLGVSLVLEDLLIFFNETDQDLFQNYIQHSNKSDLVKSEKVFLNYEKILFYIDTWKSVELLKQLWARTKFTSCLNQINTCDLLIKFNECYKKEILLPVRRTLSKGNSDDVQLDEDAPIILPKGVSDLEFKIKQISKLLEKLEINMINETSSRVQKEIRLVINERNRQDHVLCLDLWKKPIMKEDFTLNRPHISEQFTELLNEHGVEENENFIIKKDDLQKCLLQLSISIQDREKSNFEQYTMFYENLLRHHHKMLYSREREVKSLKDALINKTQEIDAEVKCQIVDSCYNLILEVTSLRTQLKDLKDKETKMKEQVEQELKQEYMNLIKELLDINQKLKLKFDVFKETTYSQVQELVSKCRTQAIQMSINLKKNFDTSINELMINSQQKQVDLINELQKEKTRLQEAILKQNTLWKIKLNMKVEKLNKQLTNQQLKSSKQKYTCLEACMVSEEKELLLEQQKQSLQKYLKKLDTEYTNLRLKLEREQDLKSKKEHESQQKNKNDKNLSNAKQNNVEKLLQELEEKNEHISRLQLIADKYNKYKDFLDSKANKEILDLKKKLDYERNIKQDAFHRCDELQTQLDDLEQNPLPLAFSRPQTGKSSHIRNHSQAKSFSNINQQQPRLNSSLSNALTPRLNESQYKLQRAKTAYPRTRSQHVDTNYDQNILHEQISLLKQIRLNSAII